VLIVTRQGAARNAASVHLRPSITRTDILVWLSDCQMCVVVLTFHVEISVTLRLGFDFQLTQSVALFAYVADR